MQLDYLAHHPEHLSTVAEWYFGEWGHLKPGDSLGATRRRLTDSLHVDRIPMVILALEHDRPIGAAQLKFHEMERYPEREHWLGGVYVIERCRGRRIAEQIIDRVVGEARRLGVRSISLQTEHLSGGLYRRMGWRPVEQVHDQGDEVLVMERSLTPVT